MSQTTDFGYQDIPVADKTRQVGEVFARVAGRYDLMNDLMSGGLHRLWKRYTVLLTGVRPGERILDLAGGTGDLAALLAPQAGPQGQVVLADINAAMLATGRTRLLNKGLAGNIHYVQANAERLPFHPHSFDGVTMAFGLRNVTDKLTALGSMWAVLKPGGRLVILEFSRPAAWIRPAYDLYSFTALPLLGRWVAKDAASYRYLAESIRRHPDQETLKAMMQTKGFARCTYFNLNQGIVAIHRGYKV